MSFHSATDGRVTSPTLPTRRPWFLWLVLVAALLAVVEGLAYVTSLFLSSEFAYRPPTHEEFHKYLKFAEETAHVPSGWLPQESSVGLDGSRLSPNAADLAEPCVSLYGDSFTFADEVTHAEAWSNVLAELIGCRVNNFGVSGYGSDQAYLRFADSSNDEAAVTILVHAAENIVRNVNQNRTFIYGFGTLVKPRFLLNSGGSLQLVPRVPLNEDDYDAFVAAPERYFHYEYFLPGQGSLSKRWLRFPYLLSVPRYLSYKRLYMSVLALWFAVPPWYAELYAQGHDSGASELTAAILAAFDRDARARGKQPLVYILPSIREINVFRDAGVWVYQPLLDLLEQNGVEAINIGPHILARIGENDPCDYLCTRKWRRSGHYTAAGNEMLARITRDILRQHALIGP
jgi:hypothetical protein